MNDFRAGTAGWSEAALLDRIVVWDRWIEAGIAPDGTKEARDAAMQIIVERVDLLREQVLLLEATGAEASDEINRLREALDKIGDITLSMCLSYKDMAERQRGIAFAALGKV